MNIAIAIVGAVSWHSLELLNPSYFFKFYFFLLFSFSVLLRYNWHTALYKFKVHSIITWPTYTEKLLTVSSMTIVIKNFFPCDEKF